MARARSYFERTGGSRAAAACISALIKPSPRRLSLSRIPLHAGERKREPGKRDSLLPRTFLFVDRVEITHENAYGALRRVRDE